MQLRCYRCGWSFAIKTDEIAFALEALEESGGNHYDVRCPRCRHTNRISIEQLRKSAPRPEQIEDEASSASGEAQLEDETSHSDEASSTSDEVQLEDETSDSDEASSASGEVQLEVETSDSGEEPESPED